MFGPLWGSHYGHMGVQADPPAGRTHKLASGPRTDDRGRGSFCRCGQLGAGGVRAGPMAAREGALLGDRVMGRPRQCAGRRGRARSLTQPRTHRPGLLPVTAARSGLPCPAPPLRGPAREPGRTPLEQGRGRAGAPPAPRSRPRGGGAAMWRTGWALRGYRLV